MLHILSFIHVFSFLRHMHVTMLLQIEMIIY